MFSLERRVLAPLRREYTSLARGDVLEIGVGTAPTLQYYPPDITLTLVDKSAPMLDEARKRALTLGREASFVKADLVTLPFPSESFDMVFSFDVLCSLRSPHASLEEVARVLRKRGKVIFIEHGRMGKIHYDLFLAIMSIFTRLVFGSSLFRDPLQLFNASSLRVYHTRSLPASYRLIMAEKPVESVISATKNILIR